MTDQPVSVMTRARRNDLAALAQRSPPGGFVEVGVYQGGSAWHLYQVAQVQGRYLHLFDTFTGIPYSGFGDHFRIGAFADTCAGTVQLAMPEAKVFSGIFPTTLTEQTASVAFAHIDCDQYRSTRDAIAALRPRMVPGGIMAFDDYPEYLGVVKAVYEVFGDNLYTTNHHFAHVIIDDGAPSEISLPRVSSRPRK